MSRSRFYLTRAALRPCASVYLCAALFFSLALPERSALRLSAPDERGPIVSDGADEELQRAASAALTGEDGVVIVMDARTGRVRALANPRAAFAESFPPGSTIKPFAALAALRDGSLRRDSRLLCRRRYTRGDVDISCAHASAAEPFSPTEALAFSCNYFFGKLGERINPRSFNDALARFGFGARTGAGGDDESTGEMPRGKWRSSNALGEDSALRVTPAQLITAYAALVNGGHLFIPQPTSASGFTPRERTTLTVETQHRETLIAGMRGAVTHGTAANSALSSLPVKIFGKTGTATADDGFGTVGWFVGFAAAADSWSVPAPDEVELAVLVFLKRGSGAESAARARGIFEAFARMGSRGERDARMRGDDEQTPARNRSGASNKLVRVRLVSAETTRTLSLEEYVLSVLAGEASVENEPEALKALAVAIRSYARRNVGRHAHEGYDFCSTTHCQRFIVVSRGRVRRALRRAVEETRGVTLRDDEGDAIEAFYSASCGGRRADINALWGVPARAYLTDVDGASCPASSPRRWMDVIPAEQLAQALRSDERSDVGQRLDEIQITRRDATGRAELVTLIGERRRQTLRGWDLKLIVGRALGWNRLKSTRFEVAREGDDFVFRGSGFGHGLGLCQDGAHALAGRGDSYREILAYYFPGARLGE